MNSRRVTGFSLLLLAGLLVASMPLSFGMLEHDPRSRDGIGDFLMWIQEHETQYGARMALLLIKDSIVSVVVGAGLLLVFAPVHRGLALAGAAGWLVSTAGFLTVDAIEASMIALADDNSLAAGEDATTLSVARTLAIVSGLIAQAAFSSLAVGLASFGILTLRFRNAGAPHVFFGWLALAGAASWLLLWSSVLTDAGFVFIPVGALCVLAWMLGMGVYLLRTAGANLEAAAARAMGEAAPLAR